MPKEGPFARLQRSPLQKVPWLLVLTDLQCQKRDPFQYYKGLLYRKSYNSWSPTYLTLGRPPSWLLAFLSYLVNLLYKLFSSSQIGWWWYIYDKNIKITIFSINVHFHQSLSSSACQLDNGLGFSLLHSLQLVTCACMPPLLFVLQTLCILGDHFLLLSS